MFWFNIQSFLKLDYYHDKKTDAKYIGRNVKALFQLALCHLELTMRGQLAYLCKSPLNSTQSKKSEFC